MCGAFFDSHFFELLPMRLAVWSKKKDPIGIGSFLLSKFESDR
jgi:hypothetical protein